MQENEGSILSPMEATEGMLKMVHGISVTQELPFRPAVPVFKSRFDTDVTPISPNGRKLAAEAAKRANKLMSSPNNISLYDHDGQENKFPLSVQEEKAKKHLAKDPKTGLTIETVKRRDLRHRFERMLSSDGLEYRINQYFQLPHLTNIQLAGLMRRSRNRSEFTDMSDEVWSHIFDEKRRYEDRTGEFDTVMTRDFAKRLSIMQNDDRSEKTDSEPDMDPDDDVRLDHSGSPVFEEIENLEEETKDAHEQLYRFFEYLETRRQLMEEEKWLALQIKMLSEKRELLKGSGVLNNEPHIVFGRPQIDNDVTQRCARCVPLIAYKKRPIIRVPLVKDVEHDIKIMSQYLGQDCSIVDDFLYNIATGLDDELDEFHMPLGERSRDRPRKPGTKSTEKTLARARARYHAKRALEVLTGSDKRNVGRPKKLSEAKPARNSKNNTPVARKKTSQVEGRTETQKKMSMIMNPVLAAEIEKETRQLEEKLSRHSYNYQEITIPLFKHYDDSVEKERQTERSSRRNSIDERCLTVEDVLEPNEAIFFAKIHHGIEYPRLTDEEIKRRKKEKIMLIPEYRPFIPELYEHENPLCDAFNPRKPVVKVEIDVEKLDLNDKEEVEDKTESKEEKIIIDGDSQDSAGSDPNIELDVIGKEDNFNLFKVPQVLPLPTSTT
ncbi:unnamed protein product [Bursaphelenchus okinawaensis]|uniref:Uncharacterized protein n=1 Tax=Bursaphelenchus okinawaensis TaxID=465554 RepID=A0A811KBA6_9BILA|nr:unnamed protein product [Bursaphelenchus okinawaensis]CAG9100813.1 unnamed protein product [Bursaphelenchus okinawaensis]